MPKKLGPNAAASGNSEGKGKAKSKPAQDPKDNGQGGSNRDRSDSSDDDEHERGSSHKKPRGGPSSGTMPVSGRRVGGKGGKGGPGGSGSVQKNRAGSHASGAGPANQAQVQSGRGSTYKLKKGDASLSQEENLAILNNMLKKMMVNKHQKKQISDAQTGQKKGPTSEEWERLCQSVLKGARAWAKAPFHRLVKEIVRDIKPDFRVKREVMDVLETVANKYVVHFLADSNKCAQHRNCKTVMSKDMTLAKRLRGEAGFVHEYHPNESTADRKGNAYKPYKKQKTKAAGGASGGASGGAA